jgi:hypothetical protein
VLERDFLPAWRSRPIGSITRGDRRCGRLQQV